MSNPSYLEVSKFLRYNPRTGLLRWIANPAYNKSQYVGKIAGAIAPNGYIVIKLFGKRHYAHRVAWLLMNYSWPSDHMDHKNGIRDDNRWSNLRIAGYANNARNRSARSKIAKGVTYFKNSRKPYSAKIVVDGKAIYLGRFYHAKDAHNAYCIAAKQYHGEFARTE